MDESLGRRYALVEELARAGMLRQPRVAAALRAIPRHNFLPGVPLEQAYSDSAIVTKIQDDIAVSSCSQPAIIAIMLEQLDLRGGQNVLEIGAGTGYNATLIGYLVGTQGKVTTLDIDEEVTAQARENLGSLGITNVQVVKADGALGWIENAPYDRVIATVGVWDLYPSWIEQLRIGGRLVAPVSLNGLQFSLAFDKTGKDRLESLSIRPCGFMRLRGDMAGPEKLMRIDGLAVTLENPEQIDEEGLRLLLAGDYRQRSLTDATQPASRGLLEFLALQRESLLLLEDRNGETLGCEFARGLMVGPRSLIILTLDAMDWKRLTPTVRLYGDESAFMHVTAKLEEWDLLGRPELGRAAITAAPLGSLHPSKTGFRVRKRWMEYQVEF